MESILNHAVSAGRPSCGKVRRHISPFPAMERVVGEREDPLGVVGRAAVIVPADWRWVIGNNARPPAITSHVGVV